MAVNDPAWGVPTPTGTLQGVAAFAWDGAAWQPSGRAMPSVATPTGVLKGVAPFSWSGSSWQSGGMSRPGVPTPTGTLDGVAVYTWSGSTWVPAGGGTTPTPSGTLQGVAVFSWDGAAWQPSGQARSWVPTPNGTLQGVAMFAWNGSAWMPAVSAPALDLNFLMMTTLDPSINFTRASIGTYFDATGTMQTAGGGVPRFDYDPVTHASRGLLIEETRTNILLNSAALGTQSVAVTAQSYVLSFYGTGTVNLSGAFTGSLAGTGAFPTRVSGAFTPTAGTLTLTVTGTVQNAQIEVGSFATTYIPTTGATVTRQPDAVWVNTGSWFSAVAGTQALDWDGLNGSTTQQGLSDGTFGNSVYLAQNGAVSEIGGTGVGPITAGSLSPAGTLNKTAVAYGASTLALGVNGAANSAAMGAGPYPWNVRMSIGCSPWAIDSQIDGHVRRVRYWPRLLSQAELVQVTT